jgi:predicted amidohydrolase
MNRAQPLCIAIACLVLIFPLRVVAAEETDRSASAKSIRVASLSILPVKWDKGANATKIERMVRQAAEQGAKLVITPEGVLEGYVVGEVVRETDPDKKAKLIRRFNEIAEPVDGQYFQRFRKLADELDIHLILGFLERVGEKTYNTAALIGPDGNLAGKYHKTHFARGYDVNPPGFHPGNDYPVFDIGSLKVGMLICFDRRPPEPARQLAVRGADLIACPAYGGWGENNARLLRVRAWENQVFLIFTHPEQSLIIDRDGDLLYEASQDAVLVHDIDLSNLNKNRAALTKRRPETYRGLAAEK